MVGRKERFFLWFTEHNYDFPFERILNRQDACSTLLQVLPAFAFVFEGEQFRVNDFGEDFQGFNEARSGTVEVLIAVGEEDFAGRDGAEALPFRSVCERRQFLPGARNIEAARKQNEDRGIAFHQL